MRYLNKVIFINSASVKFASVELDGNVHLIGTQGVGKSTLLRAILYFYNVNGSGLGIPSGPTSKSFTDYYLPFGNSYLVYEVKKETGTYCVMAFKHRSGISFRFIDAPFQEKLFMDTDGAVFERWDQVQKALLTEKISYSKIVSQNNQFRDIIYGNGKQGLGFKKYAIMESRKYGNIPKTIQSIFLNAKLDADFIKKTIISSLDNEDHQIDLMAYNKHLETFDRQMQDIRGFNDPRCQNICKKIEEQRKEYSRQLGAMSETAEQFQRLYHLYQQQSPLQKKWLSDLEQGSRELGQKIEDCKRQYAQQRSELDGQLGGIRNKIEEAKRYLKEYEAMDIQSIIDQVKQAPVLQDEKSGLENKRAVLLEQSTGIAQQFNNLQLAEEQKLSAQKNQLKEQEIVLDKQLLRAKEELNIQRQQQADDLRDRQQEKVAVLDADMEQANQQKTDQQVKVEAVKHQSFFQAEREAVLGKRATLTADVQQKSQLLAELKQEQSQLKGQFTLDDRELKFGHQQKEDALKKHQQSAQEFLDLWQQKLDDSKDSFYAWLDEHQPHWQSNIGKVVREEVLFSKQVDAQLDDAASESFFGVALNVDQLPDGNYSQENMHQQIKQGQKQLQDLAQEHQQLVGEFELSAQKLQAAFNKKNGALATQIDTLTYEHQQAQRKIRDAEAELKSLEERATVEKQEKIAEAQEQLSFAKSKVEQLKGQKSALASQLKADLQALKARFDEEEKQLIEATEEEREGLQAKVHQAELAFEQTTKKLLAERDQALASKGVDTEQVGRIEAEIKELDRQLQQIEGHKETVLIYQSRKRDLLDHLPKFEREELALQSKLIETEQDFVAQEKDFIRQLSDRKQQTEQQRKVCDHISEGILVYQKQFENGSLYQYLKSENMVIDTEETEHSADLSRRKIDLQEESRINFGVIELSLFYSINYMLKNAFTSLWRRFFLYHSLQNVKI